MIMQKHSEPGDLDVNELSLITAPQSLSPARRKRRLLTRELLVKSAQNRVSSMSLIVMLHFYK